MVEGLQSRSKAANRLIKQFEEIQETGGYWHDWLLLEQTAAKRKESHVRLAKVYAAHRDLALANYRQRLTALLMGQTRPPSSLAQVLPHLGAPQERENLCTLRTAGAVSGVSERPEATSDYPFIGVPGVIAGEIDVLPAERGDMLKQGWLKLP